MPAEEVPDQTQEEPLDYPYPDRIGVDDAEAQLYDLLNEAGEGILDTPSDTESPTPEEEPADTPDNEELADDAELQEAEPSEEGPVDVEGQDDDEDTVDEELDTAQTYTVKVDGQPVEVTLDELMSSYSFQAHNTRVSQTLAEERKKLEAEYAETSDQRERYAAGLEQLETALAGSMPDEPDWDALEKSDPTRFAAEYARFSRRRQQLEAVQAERQRVQEEQARELEKRLTDYTAHQRELLIEAVPEWRDPEKQRADLDAIRTFALDVGYTDDEINQVVDHRAVLIMRKAMKYDQLQAKGKQAVAGKKARPKKAVLKPGARKDRPAISKRARRIAAQRKRLAETGRRDDATDLFRDLLLAEEDASV